MMTEKERKSRPEVVEAHKEENDSARVATDALASMDVAAAGRVLDEATRTHEKRAKSVHEAVEFGQHTYWKAPIDLSVSADELAA